MTHLHQRGNIAPLLIKIMSAHQIHRYQNTTPKDRQNNEHISYHPQEPEENDCIESNLLYQLFLLHFYSCKPTEWLPVQLLGRMFLVGVFSSRGVDNGVSWTQETEYEEEA
jgi:hypothetical protein